MPSQQHIYLHINKKNSQFIINVAIVLCSRVMNTSTHIDNHGNYLAIWRKNKNVCHKMVVLLTIVKPLLLVMITRHLEQQLQPIHGAVDFVVSQQLVFLGNSFNKGVKLLL